MGIIDDPISGTIGTLLTHGLEKTLLKRASLAFELGLAATISFLVVAGGALLATAPPLQAVGAGMASAGIAMFATFQASPNAKGLTISVDQKTANEKLNNPTTTVERK